MYTSHIFIYFMYTHDIYIYHTHAMAITGVSHCFPIQEGPNINRSPAIRRIYPLIRVSSRPKVPGSLAPFNAIPWHAVVAMMKILHIETLGMRLPFEI